MPPSMSAAMAAEVAGQDRVYNTFKLVAAGTTLLYADGPVVSASAGVHKPYAGEGWGNFPRSMGWHNYSLVTSQATFTFKDEDRSFEYLSRGKGRGKIRGLATVECHLRSEFVEAADHFRFFSGIVDDVRQGREREYTMDLTPSRSRLESRPSIPLATRALFPEIPEGNVNTPLWVPYGIHSSLGIADSTGMIPTLYVGSIVSTYGPLWVAAYCDVQNVANIYRGGALEPAADWNVIKPLILSDGNAYTMFEYVGGDPPSAATTITWDGEGIKESPTGTAGTITNPAAQMRHFLTNFGFGDGANAGASWAPESGAPVQTSVWDDAEDHFRFRQALGAKVIASDSSVQAIFNDWCQTFNAMPYWGDTYELAVRFDPTDEFNIYKSDALIIRRAGHVLGSIGSSTSRARPANEFTLHYLLDESRGTLTQSMRVADRSVSPIIRAPDVNLNHADSRLFG